MKLCLRYVNAQVCGSAAGVWDHKKESQRVAVLARGRWARDKCSCDGACAIVDSVLAETGGALDMPPNQMSNIGRLPTDVFTRHMKCCARCLCLECHLEFTGDRATIFDD